MKKQQHSLKNISNSSVPKQLQYQKRNSLSKKSKIESNRSIQIYKCGCVITPIKSMISIRSSLPDKLVKRSKASIAKQNIAKQDKKILNNSKSFKNLVQKLDLLKQEYKSLQKDKKHKKQETSEQINYVERQVVKIIDKITYVQRPVQKLNRKIKKVSKEILTYKQVDKEVPIFKQELVFVDSQPLPAIQQIVQVPQEIVSTIIINNPINQRMKSDLQMFSSKSTEVLCFIEDSYNTISNLRSNISSLEQCLRKGNLSYTFHQTETNLPQSNQQLKQFTTVSSIRPKSEYLISGTELLSTSFLNSMVSSNVNFCEQIYLKNPQQIALTKRQNNLRLSGKMTCTQQCINACVCMRNIFKVYTKPDAVNYQSL